MAGKRSKQSRPKKSFAPPTGAKTDPPSAWIVSPFWDSILFIGAPLLCIATLVPMRAFFSSRGIAVFLLAFFTFGHHFPTFLRAYGDRELFARYRLRFLLAPPILFLAALWVRDQNLHGLFLFLSAWDIWHVLMQHYGFMRIYDSKQGATGRWASRLDWAVSISFYVALIANSPHYSQNLLRVGYLTGMPIVPSWLLTILRNGLMLLSVSLTLVYCGYHVSLWRKGRAVSFRKLATLGIFLAATYYLYVYINDFLVGFTVWSAFHCIQYYGIVWAFNRNRVARKSPMTAFARFLFRPRVGLVVLYVILILGYGTINYWTGFLTDQSLKRLLLAFVFTSNGLHYYYDGFIWKVREPQTRKYLNIATIAEGGKNVVAASLSKATQRLRPVNRGLVQAGYLAAIVLTLIGLETWRPYNKLAANQSLVAAAPQVGAAHFRLGEALEAEGQVDEALDQYRQSARLLPKSWEARNNLAGLLVKKGLLEEAVEQYRQAVALVDDDLGKSGGVADWSSLSASLQATGGAEGHDALVYSNLGDVLVLQGNRQQALDSYRRALQIDPRSVRARTNLGTTLAEMGRLQEARRELENALRIDGSYVYAHMNLGLILASLGQADGALFHFRMALKTDDKAHRRAAQAAIQRLLSAPARGRD